MVFALAVLASCSKEGPAGLKKESYLTVSPASFPTGASPAEDIRNMKAYLFRDGTLSGVQELTKDASGSYKMKTDGLVGTVYFLGNVNDSFEDPALSNPSMTEDQWLDATITSAADETQLFFTAKSVLDVASGKDVKVNAKYGLARLDLRLQVTGDVTVNSFAVRNACLGSYINQKDPVSSPAGMSRADIVREFPEGLSQDMDGMAYIHEQAGDDLSVYASVTIDGQAYEMESGLPSVVRRGTVYTVTVRKESSHFGLVVEEWNEGESTDLLPGFGGTIRIDETGSAIPENVQVTDGGRTLVLPHYATDFIMQIETDDQLEMFPIDNPWLDIRQAGETGSLDALNSFRVTKKLSAPGTEDMVVPIYFHRKGLDNSYPEDVVKVVVKGNPVKTDGNLAFGLEDNACRFGKYVENELEVFTVPEDKVISVEFDEGEDPWMKLVESEVPGKFRLLAGWKPNDPTAGGREQAGRVVISRPDGSDREEYTVSRLNYGLPVTYLHGIWWCKYNAKGNSKSFEDQVLCTEDPARLQGMTVYDYLASCSPEEYYDLWGWAYQGNSGIGMKIVEKDGKAVADGFSRNSNSHLNKLDPKLLAPEGYEVPSMEDYNRVFDATDYVWLMWNGTHTIREPWEGHSSIVRNQRRRNDVMVGSLNVRDLIYISMKSPDFPEDEGIVWYGAAAQWNDDGILHNGHYNNILFTVYSPQGNGWFFTGGMGNLYLVKNGAGNHDTRIIRFKKSPVEYIYGI